MMQKVHSLIEQIQTDESTQDFEKEIFRCVYMLDATHQCPVDMVSEITLSDKFANAIQFTRTDPRISETPSLKISVKQLNLFLCKQHQRLLEQEQTAYNTTQYCMKLWLKDKRIKSSSVLEKDYTFNTQMKVNLQSQQRTCQDCSINYTGVENEEWRLKVINSEEYSEDYELIRLFFAQKSIEYDLQLLELLSESQELTIFHQNFLQKLMQKYDS